MVVEVRVIIQCGVWSDFFSGSGMIVRSCCMEFLLGLSWAGYEQVIVSVIPSTKPLLKCEIIT